jgi:hypothetical protein
MVPEMKVLTGEIRGNHLHSTQIPLFMSCLAHFISKYFFEKRGRPLIRGKTFIFGKSNGEDKEFAPCKKSEDHFIANRKFTSCSGI